MISFECGFESIALRTQVKVKVFLPNPENFMHPVTDFRERYTFSPFKTLFLLHGIMDSADQWVENTNVVRLAQEAGFALVIPSCGNNFYVNTIYGAKYEDFLTKELIGFVRAMFPLSDKREDNFLWGISMGGYGALRTGFLFPELFSKIVAMSPTTDIEFAARFAYAMGIDPEFVIGHWKKLEGTDMDLKVLAEKAAVKETILPDLKMVIAEDDGFVRDNTVFINALQKHQIAYQYDVYPGDHTWKFWDAHVKECLDWLQSEK